MRFYGIDPERLLQYPAWLTLALYRQIPGIEAREMLSAIVVAMAPNLEPRDRQSIMRRLQNQIPADEPTARPRRRVKRDPAKAREYFEQIGAVVK